nr:hypothetical protein [Tanacetum cinerariifolium]
MLERANKVKVLKLRRLKKVGTTQRIESSADTDMKDASNQGRMIAYFDRDTGVALMDDEGTEKKAEVSQEDKPEVQEAVDVVTSAKLITEVIVAVNESVTAASATITAVPAATITAASVRVVASSTRRRKGVVIKDPDEESTTIIHAETKSKDKGKGIMVEDLKLMKKKQQVEIDEEYARKLHEELNQDIDWSVVIDHVKQKAKEDPLDYFKGMSYDDIRLIFEAKFNSNMEFLLETKEQMEKEENRATESINETPAQKAAKRRKLNKEVKDLKQHLEIVPDEDDDVYTEATPLARKVPVVDYQIIQLNNKPCYKIIRADGTHQLAMFERLDGQDQVLKSQRSVHGQAMVKIWKLLESCGVHIITFTTTQLILLVERRYPLSRFTLDQMLNAVRLRVEEESDMSLELLRKEMLQADYDLKATNIILQGLATDVYALINHHKVAKDIWDIVKLLMHGTSLSKHERKRKLYDEFDKFSHMKGETLHQYYLRVTVHQVQRRQAQNVVGLGSQGNALGLYGSTSSQAKLAFLVDPRGAYDQVSQTTTHNAAFQTDDLDVYDSECDDISSTKVVFMANLSSCDLDILSEVPYSNTFQNDMMHQSVQEL